MSHDVFIGKRVAAYLIHEELGRGGMATVYKAYHTRLHRYDAIKVIAPQVASNPAFRTRFEREAQIVASLDHQNIVKVYDFGEEGQLTYLAMQYVSGGVLRGHMQTLQPLPQQLAINYAIQMARALHHAHSKGIVHRDVKPQNMLISGQDPNHLLLSDFGIAKLYDDSYEATQKDMQPNQITIHPSMTNTGQIIGTAKYMAPEQVRKGSIDARTDVYALGIVLYQMLTGQVPFRGNTTWELMSQHVHTLPPPLCSINPTIPEVLAHVTAKALEKAPEARFQTAEEMALALEAVLNSASDRHNASMHSQSSDASHYATSASWQTSAPDSQATRETTPASIRHFQSAESKGISVTETRRKKSARMRFIAIPALLLISLVLPTIIPRGAQAPPSPNKPTFDETFNDNRLNWFSGSDYTRGLIAEIGNSKYTLTTVPPTGGTNNQGTTYFPYPRNTAQLPDNFTLRADISQSQGAPTILSGITFHVAFSAADHPSSYDAFIVDHNGDYQLLKYRQGQFIVVYQGKSAAINTGPGKSNTLQVIARGSTITCFVNNKRVLLEGSTGYAYIDSELQHGYSSLLISGPKTAFTVTHVQVMEP